MQDDIILDINGLSIDYEVPRGSLHAVNAVNLSIRKGEIIGVAGESGCGKSTLAYAIMHLLRGTGRVTAGSMEFAGTNLVDLTGEGLRRFRWEGASMVLQSAMNNLNPVITIREQLCDVMLEHTDMTKAQTVERARELLRLVQIDEERLDAYPHQLSGGMRQRIVIAMALALEPDLVIMDEPTTGLDVVVQYMIMHQIADLSREMGFAILIISHDLPLLLEVCDTLAIMYAGKIVEVGDREVMLNAPVHPYTHGLVNAFPPLTGPRVRQSGIPGSIPDLVEIEPGCMFRDRCPQRMRTCDTVHPSTVDLSATHRVACYLASQKTNQEVNDAD